jgi:hypothetical protein
MFHLRRGINLGLLYMVMNLLSSNLRSLSNLNTVATM